MVTDSTNTGILRYFGEIKDDVQEQYGFTDEEMEFVSSAMQIMVDSEVAYKCHIEGRTNPDIDRFREDMRGVGEDATELVVVAEMLGHDFEGDDYPVTSIVATAAAMSQVSDCCSVNTQTIGNAEEAEILYEKITTSRKAIPIMAECIDDGDRGDE